MLSTPPYRSCKRRRQLGLARHPVEVEDFTDVHDDGSDSDYDKEWKEDDAPPLSGGLHFSSPGTFLELGERISAVLRGANMDIPLSVCHSCL